MNSNDENKCSKCGGINGNHEVNCQHAPWMLKMGPSYFNPSEPTCTLCGKKTDGFHIEYCDDCLEIVSYARKAVDTILTENDWQDLIDTHEEMEKLEKTCPICKFDRTTIKYPRIEQERLNHIIQMDKEKNDLVDELLKALIAERTENIRLVENFIKLKEEVNKL